MERNAKINHPLYDAYKFLLSGSRLIEEPPLSILSEKVRAIDKNKYT